MESSLYNIFCFFVVFCWRSADGVDEWAQNTHKKKTRKTGFGEDEVDEASEEHEVWHEE